LKSLTDNLAANRAFQCMQAGDAKMAEQLCREMLTGNAKDTVALCLLGQALSLQGRHEEAAATYKRCVTIAPKEIDHRLLLAEAYLNLGRYGPATTHYDKALRLDGTCGPALAGKANVLIRQEEWDKARAVLEPVVAAGREDAGVAIVYARIEVKARRYREGISLLERHIGDRVPEEMLRTIHHEIGRAHERLEEFDEAFAAFTKSNELGKGRWEPEAESNRMDQMVEAFSGDRLARLPRASHGSEVPVFIVGIMRSGSTLTEQIIDAHPKAHGAGELLALPNMCNQIGVRIGSIHPYPQCAAEFNQRDVDALSADYLEQLTSHAPRAERICDKYLGSYQHLGLISVLFPQARVIHTRRNPMDTCLSCYTQRFAPSVPASTDRLDHLGMFYNDYLHVMHRWREVLDVNMLELDYEDLVSNQEAASRRIIDFCGLRWDDACLRFHETGRTVLTLSREQVNKPMYTSSVERWRRYEKHLQPLLEIIESGVRGNGTIRAGI
jgi:tetratricopeptide (TPR) repeat protein